jgi:hypothetical protein
MTTGTSFSWSLPSFASSITQSDSTECVDQNTTTQLDALIARSMARSNLLPGGRLSRSHQTRYPLATSAAATSLTRWRSSRA